MSRPLTTSTSRLTPSSSRISSQFTMLLLLLVVTVSIILQAPQPINAMSTMNKNQNQKRSLIPSSSQPQKQKRISLSRSSSSSSSSSPRREQQQQQLTPPFPNGLCGGTILEISPEETFGVENLSVLGDMMLLPRTIKIWLPPGYNNNDSNENEIFNNIRQQKQRHPVLYVHDGQNAMEDEDSWTGASWRLMGALTRLADHKLIGSNILPIVVLLPSADGDLLPGVRRRHLVRICIIYIYS